MLLFFINKKQLIVSFVIGLISAVGDKSFENQTDPLFAALCDNITHALIGAFTWIGILIAKTSKTDLYFLFEVILCGLCSSVIDVDHFIAAKSVHLKNATNLKNRPFLHCTTLGTIIVFSLLLCSYYFKIPWLHKFAWILAAAFLSHHLRDSKRRGFWLWPFGHTPPTPNVVYFAAQMFLPQFLPVIMTKFTVQEFKNVRISAAETV